VLHETSSRSAQAWTVFNGITWSYLPPTRNTFDTRKSQGLCTLGHLLSLPKRLRAQPYLHGNLHSRVFVLCVFVYSGFMYRGLAVLRLYATLILFAFTLHYITSTIFNSNHPLFTSCFASYRPRRMVACVRLVCTRRPLPRELHGASTN